MYRWIVISTLFITFASCTTKLAGPKTMDSSKVSGAEGGFRDSEGNDRNFILDQKDARALHALIVHGEKLPNDKAYQIIAGGRITYDDGQQDLFDITSGDVVILNGSTPYRVDGKQLKEFVNRIIYKKTDGG